MLFKSRTRTLKLALTTTAAMLGLAVSVANPGAASAASSHGVNDWTCVPSAAHPSPVVLWHGLGSNGDEDMGTMAQYLSNAGYCTYYETYGTTFYGPYSGGLASMRSSALELKSFVGRVLASTGAAKVDIVGHSEGTTVPAYYMKFDGGGAVVDQFVGYGSNFQGTSLNGLQTLSQVLGFQAALNSGGCPACNEFAPNSQFTADLNAGGVTVSGPHYTSIVTQRDEVVTPYTSGILAAAPNVTNITLQNVCPTDQGGHVALAIDPNVEQIVGNALDPAHAVPVNCVPMPFAF